MIPILAPLLVLSEESVPVLHWSHLAGDITYIVADNEVSVFDWKAMMVNVLWVIYIVGIIVVMLKMMYGLSKIFRYYQQGQKEDFNGYRIITTEAVHLPFSFFKGIYVSRHVPLQDHIHTILEHEEIHIRQWHTVDVLMAEMVHAFFWFNPVMIFYKRALRQAHEFLADDLICRKNSVSSYTELLLSKSQSGLELALTNQFFHSQIKKRIIMMTKNKSNVLSKWKYALAVPPLFIMVTMFANLTIKKPLHYKVFDQLVDTLPLKPTFHSNEFLMEDIKQITNEQDKILVKTKNGKMLYFYKNNEMDMKAFHNTYGPIPIQESDPFLSDSILIADEKPIFKGCEHLNGFEKIDCSNRKLLEYVYNNIKYPEAAREENIKGKCIVQFMINKDGKVSDTKFIKSLHSSISDEVTRMINSMNDSDGLWMPAIENGKKVNTMYTLPIKFEFEESKTENTQTNPLNKTTVSSLDKARIQISEMPFFNGTPEMTDPVIRWSESAFLSNNFITKNLKYPLLAKEKGVEGKVVVRFTVKKDGSITNAHLKEDIGYGCGEEALRIVKLMPTWIPATKDGAAIESITDIQINFKLSKMSKKVFEKNSDIKLNIFPNPSSDWIKVSLEGLEIGPAEIKIYDYYGKELMAQKLNINDSKYEGTIDISHLNTQVIIVHILQGDFSTSQKVSLKK